MALSCQLQEQMERFLVDHDLASLYREYKWQRDTWENGFPDMRQLEVDLTMAAKYGYLTKTHILSVARWGGLRNIERVQCPEFFEIAMYDGDNLDELLRTIPSALRLLRENIKGMGPTYFSKVLMFSQPQLYGAIDTRLVRVFGEGDTDFATLRWLSLKVKNYGYGWYIPESQNYWPGEYSTWIETLHCIASLCNTSGRKCPHPYEYITIGLRDKGIWIAADVETALFSYASQRLGRGNSTREGAPFTI